MLVGTLMIVVGILTGLPPLVRDVKIRGLLVASARHRSHALADACDSFWSSVLQELASSGSPLRFSLTLVLRVGWCLGSLQGG